MGSPRQFEATRRRCLAAASSKTAGWRRRTGRGPAARRSRFGDGIGVADVGTDGERHGLAEVLGPRGTSTASPASIRSRRQRRCQSRPRFRRGLDPSVDVGLYGDLCLIPDGSLCSDSISAHHPGRLVPSLRQHRPTSPTRSSALPTGRRGVRRRRRPPRSAPRRPRRHRRRSQRTEIRSDHRIRLGGRKGPESGGTDLRRQRSHHLRRCRATP